jgi:hypothetical protein
MLLGFALEFAQLLDQRAQLVALGLVGRREFCAGVSLSTITAVTAIHALV